MTATKSRKKKSPYETLGVKPGASKDEITKAYRKKAMKQHPDRGGDADDFRETAAAYGVLSDPSRRQRFDETGQTDQEQNPALQFVIASLNKVLMRNMEAGSDLEKIDIVSAVKKEITELMGNVEGNIKEHNRRAKKLKAVAKRFSVNDGENLMAKFVLHPAAELERAVKCDKETLGHLKIALEIAGKYQYRHEAPSKTKTNDPVFDTNSRIWLQFGSGPSAKGWTWAT